MPRFPDSESAVAELLEELLPPEFFIRHARAAALPPSLHLLAAVLWLPEAGAFANTLSAQSRPAGLLVAAVACMV